MRAVARRTAIVLAALALALRSVEAQPPAAASPFASEIGHLSEPEGSFDTDNLISNESRYLEVIPTLISEKVTGGTYIGVGPDQNFSYIARIRPTLAYIIDIRRDNLLLHLLFKALFTHSRSRVEYLSLLTGRAPPADLDGWRHATIAQLVEFVDGRAPDPARVEGLRHMLQSAVAGFGVPLSSVDLDTIDRFHRTFIAAGLDLQFNSFGRPPHPYYPTLRDLLLATDAAGQTWNYLAREDDFQFLRSLQVRDRIIPVVGNLAGTHAMPAIARAVAARRSHVSAFYISNVETYLGRDGGLERFDENIQRLPRNSRSVLIRSIFFGGDGSRSVVAPMRDP